MHEYDVSTYQRFVLNGMLLASSRQRCRLWDNRVSILKLDLSADALKSVVVFLKKDVTKFCRCRGFSTAERG